MREAEVSNNYLESVSTPIKNTEFSIKIYQVGTKLLFLGIFNTVIFFGEVKVVECVYVWYSFYTSNIRKIYKQRKGTLYYCSQLNSNLIVLIIFHLFASQWGI